MIGIKWWYYAFVRPEAPARAWWERLAGLVGRRRYSHVVAFRYDVLSDNWIYLEWSRIGLFVDILDKPEVDTLIAHVRLNGGDILEYKAPPASMQRFPAPFAHYCVPFMATLANIHGWILTPDGLHRALRKRGAKVAFAGIQPLKGHADGRHLQQTKPVLPA